jgi:RHS repeat-associated protein
MLASLFDYLVSRLRKSHLARLLFTGQTISGASNSYGISGVDMLSREYVDTYGRKVLAMQADPNDLPGASKTTFTYSPLSELLTVTDPLGAVTTYTYDMAGRQLSEVHPDRGLTETAYDKASNVVGITNEATRALNGSITLDYDFNRLVSKTMAGSVGTDLYDIQYTYGNATSGSGKNGIGRVIEITQGKDANGNAFKTDHLKYDELGNVSVETKDFVVPNVGNRSYTTTKLYDSFGRIRRAVYPDGDQVSYGYTGLGELYSIASSLTGFPTQDIVSSVRYDGYGNIKTLAYGNGTQTDYTYSANTKSLFGSEVLGKVAGGTTNVSLMDRAYTYNGNGMIANMTRGIHTSLVSAGENVQTTAFEYDHLGRLGLATTSFAGTAGNQYSVSTSYNKAGGILDKVSTPNASSQVYAATSQEMKYDLSYRYSSSKPHQLVDVISSVGAPYAKAFSYNASGSISEITDMTGSDHSSFFWGQEQLLCGVQNAQGIHHYVYDHAGERVMKSSITQTTVQLNDQTINTVSTLEPYTLYVNPYYVITAFSNADRKSKHYYMGTQRVATDIGVEYWASPTPQESTGGRDNTAAKVGTTSSGASSPEQSQGYLDDLQRVLEQLSEGLEVGDVTMTSTPIESFYPEFVQESAAAESAESVPPLYSGSRILYWYHPDYVSNVDLVTDRTGEAYELFLYNAWGESLHHWTSSSSNAWSSPYRFNSKELDTETGMHYYGARYHHPKLSVWMSVDPLANKFPTWTPFHFVHNNPTSLIDPKGMSAEPPINGIAWFYDDTGEYFWNEEQGAYDHHTYNKDGSTSFSGYYSADEFAEPVGRFGMIFDLSNVKSPDQFNPENTIPLAGEVMAYLEMKGGLKDISNQEKYPGVKIYSSKSMNGAVTLGNVIFTNPTMEGAYTIDHEYGHYLDFKYHFNFNQDAYLKEIGLPSLWSAIKATFSDWDHHNSITEKRADILGEGWTGNELYSGKMR